MQSARTMAPGPFVGAQVDDLRGREVVVGFDGSVAARAAVRWAATEAARLGSPLGVVYAADVPVLRGDGATTSVQDVHELAAQVAREGAALARRTSPGLVVRSHGVVAGAPAELVASSAQAGLLVLGRRAPQSGQGHGALGSVSFAVVLHSRCPVVVVHEERDQVSGSVTLPVVAGIDGSRAAAGALAVAAQFAQARGSGLHVICAWGIPPKETWAQSLAGTGDLAALTLAGSARAEEKVAGGLAWVREAYPGLRVSGQAVEGDPAVLLTQASSGSGLVVVGSRGQGGFAGLMIGSVGHSVLRSSHCPVVVVRRGSL